MINSTIPITIIEPKKGWIPIDLRQIWNYRELFYFLTKRDIKVRYKQTVLGGLWAIMIACIIYRRIVLLQVDGKDLCGCYLSPEINSNLRNIHTKKRGGGMQ